MTARVTIERTCAGCQQVFTRETTAASAARIRFCSKTCNTRWQARRYRERNARLPASAPRPRARDNPFAVLLRNHQRARP